MKTIRFTFFAVALGLGSACAMAQAVEAGGIRFDTTVQVGGKPALLNGVGVRYRALFKVAAVALYLPKKANTAEEALAVPGPKRIHMVMLRTLDSKDVGRVLSSGIEANATKQEFIAVLPGLARIGEVSSQLKTMSPGDSVMIEWAPDAGGASFYVNGKQVAGPYNDYGAFSGFAKIWLGKSAMDKGLKDELLGRSAAPAEQQYR